MADAQAKEQARCIWLALGLNRHEQIIDRLFLPAFATEQIGAMFFKAEDVGRFCDPAKIEKLLNRLFAQAFNIESGAADEVAQTLEPLCRADQTAGAANINLPFFPHSFGAADGAMGRKGEGFARLITGEIVDDLGDDIAGALDNDSVAGSDTKARNLVGIVQGDIGDDDAADGHGREAANGGELARPADLDVDGFQRGLRAFCGEFVGDGPTRRLCDEAQPLLPVEPVDFVDHAINVEGQIGAPGLYGAVVGDKGIETVDAGQHVGHGQAPARDCLHDAQLRIGGQRAVGAPAMG